LDAERERVRKEEKDKLYPQLDELRGTVTVLTQERADRIAAEEEAQRQAAEAERLRQEAEMSAADRLANELAATNSTWEQRFAAMEEDRKMERALLAKESEFRALEDYKARRQAEESENIVPQFVDLVRGNTREEIDTSIEDMKARSAALLADIQEQQQGLRRQIPLPVTGGGSVGSSIAPTDERVTLTPEQLADLSPEEYAAMRPQLLSAVGQRVRDGGLYAP
jgi:fused signal recognition particle receptor